MRPGSKLAARAAVLVVAAIGLVLPSGASAASQTYAGDLGADGAIQLRVDTKRERGKTIRTVARVVADQTDAFCRGGGTAPLNLRSPLNARIARSGGFEQTIHGNDQGYRSVLNIKGDLHGREISGLLSFTGESPLFGSCSTGVLEFDALRTTGSRRLGGK